MLFTTVPVKAKECTRVTTFSHHRHATNHRSLTHHQVLTPAFYYIPKAALAAIIIMSVWRMIDAPEVRRIFIVSKQDGVVWLTSFVACLFWSLEFGILLAIAVSVLLSLCVLSPSLPDVVCVSPLWAWLPQALLLSCAIHFSCCTHAHIRGHMHTSARGTCTHKHAKHAVRCHRFFNISHQ
jgi:hypothetical protein